jgi:membrane protease YdiL (CAAX protease family)
MTNEIPPPSADKESSLPIQPARPPINTLFRHELGLRAGWRLVMYIVILVIFSVAINLALDKVFHLPRSTTPSPMRLLVMEMLSLAIVFLPAWLMSWFEHRPVGDYGLPLHSLFGVRFWQGCGLGVVEITALMGCLAAFGGYSFGSLNIHGPDIFKWAGYWAGFFIVVGLFEEFTFRGYLQFTLADGVGFWPAAWILSLGFGAVHLMNSGESSVGALSVATIGLIFALTLKRTGNLWFVVGWHAAFDFGETFLFSVPNSGTVFEGHLSNATLHGATWLTGGTVGPEGSVFSFITMGAAALLIHKAFPARKCPDTTPAGEPASRIRPQ